MINIKYIIKQNNFEMILKKSSNAWTDSFLQSHTSSISQYDSKIKKNLFQKSQKKSEYNVVQKTDY